MYTTFIETRGMLENVQRSADSAAYRIAEKMIPFEKRVMMNENEKASAMENIQESNEYKKQYKVLEERSLSEQKEIIRTLQSLEKELSEVVKAINKLGVNAARENLRGAGGNAKKSSNNVGGAGPKIV